MSVASSVTALPVAPSVRILRVRFDRVYGLIKCYPDCDDSERFARLTRTKTLSPEAIEICRALGYRITTGPSSVALLEDFLRGGA